MSRALLLSGSLGSGHDTLAEACTGSLVARGWSTRTVDAMALLGQHGPAALGDFLFRRILSVPSIYDAFHFDQLRRDGWIARRLDATAMRFLWPNLLEATADFPADLLIAVFATGARAAGRWKQERPNATTVVFNTDLVSYSWWTPEGIDLFLVTSVAAEAWVRRLAPRAEVAVVTAPVRPEFYEPPDRAAARASLSVPIGERCVLLMAGGWGLGSLPALARHLAQAGIWVLAVAGHNTRLAAELSQLAAADKRVVAFGYTNRVAELMAAADVVVCAPGDTCREARAVGRGMVLLDVVPGHGRENLQHELELGHAAVAPIDPADISRAVAAFLDDPDHEPSHRVGSSKQWDRELTDALARVGVSLDGDASG